MSTLDSCTSFVLHKEFAQEDFVSLASNGNAALVGGKVYACVVFLRRSIEQHVPHQVCVFDYNKLKWKDRYDIPPMFNQMRRIFVSRDAVFMIENSNFSRMLTFDLVLKEVVQVVQYGAVPVVSNATFTDILAVTNEFLVHTVKSTHIDAFDLITNTWRQCKLFGEVPSNYLSANCSASYDTVYIFSMLSRNVHHLSILKHQNHSFICSKFVDVRLNPFPLKSVSMTLVNDRLFVFGGVSSSSALEVLDLRTKTWLPPFGDEPRLTTKEKVGHTTGVYIKGRGILYAKTDYNFYWLTPA